MHRPRLRPRCKQSPKQLLGRVDAKLLKPKPQIVDSKLPILEPRALSREPCTTQHLRAVSVSLSVAVAVPTASMVVE